MPAVGQVMGEGGVQQQRVAPHAEQRLEVGEDLGPPLREGVAEADRGDEAVVRGAADPGQRPIDRFPPMLDQFRIGRSEEHTSELQSRQYLVCRLLLEKKKNIKLQPYIIVVKLYLTLTT